MKKQAVNAEDPQVEGESRAEDRKGRDEDQLGELFIRSLNSSLQVLDPWGKYAGLSREDRIEKLFLCPPDKKREIAGDCRVSPVVQTQVSVFFQALAAALEHRSGDLMQSMVELNEEGFGRAIIYSGRTVLVADSFRGGHPFPFSDISKAEVYGVSCLREGLQNRERFKHLTSSVSS